MIKHINPQNILISPFIAAKSRALSNIENDDLVLLEQTSSIDGSDISVALDYVDYNTGNPVLNTSCNLALEQQPDDLIEYQAGTLGMGTFNSQSAQQNLDGTYKSLVYNTIKNSFYNNYNNPTEMLGMEYIDFPLSNTQRSLTNTFRMFSIPQFVMGDKIQPGTIQFYDNLLDDNVSVFDDGYQNLIAGFKLFSSIQEIRTYASGTNPQVLLPGTASYSCPAYGVINLTNPLSVYIEPNSTARFYVTASGFPGPIVLQWFYQNHIPIVDSAHIIGSNTPSLIIYNADLPDTSFGYYVTAQNADGVGATSSLAYIYLLPPQVSNPSDVNTVPSANVSFSVTASGGGNVLTYQWFYGNPAYMGSGYPLVDTDRITGSYLVNGSSSILYINDVQLTDVGHYFVQVSDDGGTAQSEFAYLTLITGYMTQSVTESLLYPPAPLDIGTTLLFGNATPIPPWSEGTITTFGTTLQSGYIINELIPIYGGFESASVGVTYESGSIFNVIENIYGGYESASIGVAYESGSIFNVLVPIYGGYESASIGVAYESGSATTVVVVTSINESNDTYGTFGISFLSGSVM